MFEALIMDRKNEYPMLDTPWFAPISRPRSERMARPVGKWLFEPSMNSLHKRIRLFGYAVGQDGDPRIPVLIRGAASRCHFLP